MCERERERESEREREREQHVSTGRISTRWKKAHNIYNIEAAEVKGE